MEKDTKRKSTKRRSFSAALIENNSRNSFKGSMSWSIG